LISDVTVTPREKQHRFRIILAFTLLYVCWGSTFMAIAVAVKNMPPLVMGATRFTSAGLLMLGYCLMSGRKIVPPFRELLVLGAIGVLLLTTGNVVVGWAEQYVPSGLSALILAITPIWVAVFEGFVLRKVRLSPRSVAGLALGIVGLAVLMWPRVHTTTKLGRMELIGCLVLIWAALSWTLGTLLSKYTSVSVDPFTATGWQMLLSGIVNASAAALFGNFAQAHWNAEAIGSIAYLVTGGSLLGFTAYIWLLEHVATGKVATYAYVNPVIAVILGAVFLHEKVDPFIAAGTAIIVAGVVLVTTANVKKVNAPSTPKQRPSEIKVS
jgi:drug/metabolite transporter (DMT)-like permease